jgi:hypothetical protein
MVDGTRFMRFDAIFGSILILDFSSKKRTTLW